MKQLNNTILDCGHKPSPHSNITGGYGEDAQGKTSCYECCAKSDIEYMDKEGKIMLYLCTDNHKDRVTNWPNSLSFPVKHFTVGHHNFAGVRYDVWFEDHNGRQWHGVQYGDNTQICHCKRSKN